MTLNQIVNAIKFQIRDDVQPKYNLYAYGSQVYGTNDENSDFDFQLIIEDGYMSNLLELELKKRIDADISVSGIKEFQAKLDAHDVAAVETFFLPQQFRFQEDFKLHFELDKAALRNSFSRVVSNSYVKAKKKLVVAEDYDERVARKSLFHSFRILDLGIQIVQGKEIDYGRVNSILTEINALPADWDTLDATFRIRHNEMQSEFRLICPK